MRNFITALYEIAFAFETVITIVYWGFLFQGYKDGFTFYLDLNGHGFPLIALLIDFILNPVEFYIRRYLFLLLVALLYVLVNLSYTLAYQPVYSILKWTDYFSYVLSVGAFAIGLVMYLLGLIAYHCFCK